ncbi:tetratricopeptide repeat protein [Shewanella salipaludis]|uniref:Sel1 repeat family protein n=1 Tax=Shewanella salipaludis TaxID=2723052 RepID=A0A972G7B8_9GAMM|nr:sel1 repeat family protein [Shewanella salipaludis]NMH65835.1 sel1 repeat family protein [Shewanella salipaludis]
MKYLVKMFLLVYLFSNYCSGAEARLEFESRMKLINEMSAADDFGDVNVENVIVELGSYEGLYPSEVYNLLGKIYLSKATGVRDVNKSIAYLTKSAELGFTQSNEGLGLIYSSVPEFIDYDKSYKYFRVAAEKGSGLAMYSIYYLYSLGAIPEADGLFWLEKSASTGLVDAIYFLADEKLEKAKQHKDVKEIAKILDSLEKVNLEEFEGAKYYTMWRYYGNKKLGVYDFEKALGFLRLSAEDGFDESVKILNEYERLVELQNEN